MRSRSSKAAIAAFFPNPSDPNAPPAYGTVNGNAITLAQGATSYKDDIGPYPAVVLYYRAHKRTPCGVQVYQAMSVDCASGDGPAVVGAQNFVNNVDYWGIGSTSASLPCEVSQTLAWKLRHFGVHKRPFRRSSIVSSLSNLRDSMSAQRIVFAAILVSLHIGAVAAQAGATTSVTYKSMSWAVAALVERYGYIITLETPHYVYEDDLEDTPAENRNDLARYPLGRAPKILLEKWESHHAHHSVFNHDKRRRHGGCRPAVSREAVGDQCARSLPRRPKRRCISHRPRAGTRPSWELGSAVLYLRDSYLDPNSRTVGSRNGRRGDCGRECRRSRSRPNHAGAVANAK